MSTQIASVRTRSVAACLGAILAAACGGDGDDGTQPPQLVPITSQNQVAVARAAAVNFANLGSVRELPVANASGTPDGAVAAFTKHALGAAVTTARLAQARAWPLTVSAETEACPVSGSMTATFDDRDNNGLPSAGDVITTTFSDCRPTPSSLITGAFTVNIVGFSETQLSGLIVYGQLVMTDEGDTFAVNGQANLSYSESVDAANTLTARITMAVTTAGLTARGSTSTYIDTFTYDPDFTAVWTDVTPSASTPYSTSSLDGQVHVASLNGRLFLTTQSAIHEWWTEDFPDSGTVLVEGLRSRLRLTVLNTMTARLELDANDDGAFESTRDITLAELMP